MVGCINPPLLALVIGLWVAGTSVQGSLDAGIGRMRVFFECGRTGKAGRGVGGWDGSGGVGGGGGCCHCVGEDAVMPVWGGSRFRLEECISGGAMLNGRAAVVPDVWGDRRVPVAVYKASSVRSLVMTPIGTPIPPIP